MAPEPRRNPDLVGHAEAERTLIHAARSGRLAHAWLIAGPLGIGKATLAHRFARWLLEGAPTGPDGSLWTDPAGRTFHLAAAGTHPDLLTIEKGVREGGKARTEIVIADVRAASGFVRMTPAIAPWRVVICDAADDLNVNAANALLKILEEPPPNAILLLVAHAPARLLPALRSRCRRLDLRPLGVANLQRVIGPWIADDAQARVLTDLAEGSPGRALALIEAGGPELYQDVAAVMAGLPALDMAAVHDLAERWTRRGADETFRTGMDLLRAWIERYVAGRAGAGARQPGLDAWVEVWDNVGRLTLQADGLRLDRKQVVIAAFSALAYAARG